MRSISCVLYSAGIAADAEMTLSLIRECVWAFFDKFLLGSASSLLDRAPGKYGISIFSMTGAGQIPFFVARSQLGPSFNPVISWPMGRKTCSRKRKPIGSGGPRAIGKGETEASV